MNSFQFISTPKIVFAEPVDQAVLAFCHSNQIQKVTLITDKNLTKIGLLKPTVDTLHAHSILVDVFDDVEPDPSAQTVKYAAESIQQYGSQLVIGFGGGSSLDVAKVASVLAANDTLQSLEAMFGINQIQGVRLPLMLIPTTAGTGSEVTPIAILTTGSKNKSGVVSGKLLPDCAVLDPRLTLGLPGPVTAATGIDAMVHAIEAFTSKIRKNPMSDGLAKSALTLLSANILTAVNEANDIAARSAMMLGSMLAGQAFANAPVGGVHALAYPLGGQCHIPHGLSNALMLPHVLRFNLSHAQAQYAELALVVCPDVSTELSQKDKALKLIRFLEKLISDVGLPSRLRDCGVDHSCLASLAEEAMQQQRLLVNNPVTIEYHNALALYQQAY